MSPVSHAADLLLEIGTEELPAAYLPGLIKQLGKEATVILEARHLSFRRCTPMARRAGWC